MDFTESLRGANAPLTPVTAQKIARTRERLREVEMPLPGKIFCAFVALECFGLAAVIVTGMAKSNEEDSGDSDGHTDDQDLSGKQLRYYYMLALYCVTGFAYFAIDSVVQENVFQFGASVGAHCMITIFIWFHRYSKSMGHFFDDISLALVVVVSLCMVALAVTGKFLVEEFGYRIFQVVGGDLNMRRGYKMVSIFESLIKFDFFLGVLLVLMSSFFLYGADEHLIMNGVALFVTLVLAVSGFQSVRREARRPVYTFLAFCVVEPAFIVYKLWELDAHPERFPDDVTFPQYAVVGGLAVIVRTVMVFVAWQCVGNFGIGLRERVFHYAPRRLEGDDDRYSVNTPTP